MLPLDYDLIPISPSGLETSGGQFDLMMNLKSGNSVQLYSPYVLTVVLLSRKLLSKTLRKVDRKCVEKVL